MTAPVYKKKDFVSDQVVRWCPGCGDYSILSQVQATFAGLGVLREDAAHGLRRPEPRRGHS